VDLLKKVANWYEIVPLWFVDLNPNANIVYTYIIKYLF